MRNIDQDCDSSVFKHRETNFSFEFKYFRFQINNSGTGVLITESNCNNSFKLSIDFGGAGWLIANLRRAMRDFSNERFIANIRRLMPFSCYNDIRIRMVFSSV